MSADTPSNATVRRRLLYGGTFDPVHTGHVDVALAAGRLLGADRVTLIVAADPPHKPAGATASAAHRLAMTRLAAAPHALLDVCDLEVRRGGTSYTIDTVEELRSGPCLGESLLLLLGEDSLPLLPTWRRIRELVALVPIAVARRPDAPATDWDALEAAVGADAVAGMRARWLATPLVAISSSQIRARRAAGKTVRCWVPDPVADYIEEQGLYLSPSQEVSASD